MIDQPPVSANDLREECMGNIGQLTHQGVRRERPPKFAYANFNEPRPVRTISQTVRPGATRIIFRAFRNDKVTGLYESSICKLSLLQLRSLTFGQLVQQGNANAFACRSRFDGADKSI
jgi:hypothetical protein